jgi:hypothetical protein
MIFGRLEARICHRETKLETRACFAPYGKHLAFQQNPERRIGFGSTLFGLPNAIFFS